jgi:hypothetical protein
MSELRSEPPRSSDEPITSQPRDTGYIKELRHEYARNTDPIDCLRANKIRDLTPETAEKAGIGKSIICYRDYDETGAVIEEAYYLCKVRTDEDNEAIGLQIVKDGFPQDDFTILPAEPHNASFLKINEPDGSSSFIDPVDNNRDMNSPTKEFRFTTNLEGNGRVEVTITGYNTHTELLSDLREIPQSENRSIAPAKTGPLETPS